MSEESKLRKQARRGLEEFRLIVRKARKAGVDAEIIEEAGKNAKTLEQALKDKETADQLRPKLEAFEDHIAAHLDNYRPNPYLETIKALLIAGLIAFGIRWAFIEPFRIPSGSMIPTLLIGDQLMVNKMSFGPDLYIPSLGEPPEDEDGVIRLTYRPFGLAFSLRVKKLWTRRDPERGEVVVFRFPHNHREDYIKRVIGLPGDTVSIQSGDLYINGKLQAARVQGPYDGPLSRAGCPEPTLFLEDLEKTKGTKTHDVIHCRPDVRYSDFGPITVPAGHFFAMGDNRDLSADSRSWGFVPVQNLKGEALFIHLPLDPDRRYLPRWKRFFKGIK